MTTFDPNAATPVGLSQTINDVLLRYPQSMIVFHALNIHTCCHRELTLETAASRASVEPAVLLELLDAVVHAEGPR